MNKQVAVMDLGTNTFHLLIAEGDGANPSVLFKITEPVKLGEGGINNGVIQPAAYARGIKAMQQFHGHISKYNIRHIKAIATSALRNASNGKDFIDEVKNDTGIVIETINGDLEADYIYKGVKSGGCLSKQNSLILDIGGGSVEFIVGNENEILFERSFEIGAARLMDKFHRTDPIPEASIAELNAYLEAQLAGLLSTLPAFTLTNLIGSSGAFETFAEVIETGKGNEFDLKKTTTYWFEDDEFLNVTSQLINSTHADRENNKAIAPIRVDMIVSSALVTRFVMQKLGISTVIMTTNSLKEGVLAGMLDQ